MVYAGAYLQGATAPASRAGCLLLTNAEMLSGLVTVVIMDELVRWVKAYLAGVTVDDVALAATELPGFRSCSPR